MPWRRVGHAMLERNVGHQFPEFCAWNSTIRRLKTSFKSLGYDRVPDLIHGNVLKGIVRQKNGAIRLHFSIYPRRKDGILKAVGVLAAVDAFLSRAAPVFTSSGPDKLICHPLRNCLQFSATGAKCHAASARLLQPDADPTPTRSHLRLPTKARAFASGRIAAPPRS